MGDLYRVVSAESTYQLERRVNALLEEGWITAGGVTAVPAKSSSLFREADTVKYCQSVYKETK